MSALTLRSLDTISARWAELPAISYGRHPVTLKKAGPHGYCLTEKIAAVLAEPHSADPVGVARTICDYAFALGNLVTLPALLTRGDPLASQRARLDATGPRIAAACGTDADIERRCRVICVGLTFHIAAGWLATAGAVGATQGAGKPGLAEHAAELAAIADIAMGESLTSKEARVAAERTADAATNAARVATSNAGRAAKAAARKEHAEDVVAWLERKAAASAACAASNQARWDAFQAFTPWDRTLWSAPYAAELAARKATTWPPAGATELPQAIQAHIRFDADALLDALDAMIVLWDDAETRATSSGAK